MINIKLGKEEVKVYPYIGKSKITGTIVLFTNKEYGVVLYAAPTSNKYKGYNGRIDDEWKFLKLDESVVISN